MRDAAVQIVAGSASGTVCTLIGHPLDCVKVRQQADAARGRPASTAARAARMLREEGIGRGLRARRRPAARRMPSHEFADVRGVRRVSPHAARHCVRGLRERRSPALRRRPALDAVRLSEKIEAQVRGSRPLAVLGATRPASSSATTP